MAIRPLNRVPIPVIGESAYGYTRRFAACLGYEKLDAFRRAVKLREFGPTSEFARWERLAALAGFPVEALYHMRWRDPGSGKDRGIVNFLGQPLRATHLSFSRMRFCPACLKQDGPPEQRLLRDHWSLFMGPVCVRHGTLLVDTCDDCGDTFEFRRKTGVWSCGCGKEMVDLATRPASAAARGVTMALHAHFGEARAIGHVNLSKAGMLPSVFQGLPLNDLASVVDRIGVVASTPADEDAHVDGGRLNYKAGRIDQDRTIVECARQIEHAYPILRDWPVGFERLVADVAERNPSPTTDHKVLRLFATRMGRLLLDPLKGVDGRPIGLLDAVLRDWLRREHGYRWGQRVDVPRHSLRGTKAAPGPAERQLAAMSRTVDQAISDQCPSPALNKLQRRINKLVEDDVFMQASKLRALLLELWPARSPINPAAATSIRVRKTVRAYGKRKFPQNTYSVKDALALVGRNTVSSIA